MASILINTILREYKVTSLQMINVIKKPIVPSIFRRKFNEAFFRKKVAIIAQISNNNPYLRSPSIRDKNGRSTRQVDMTFCKIKRRQNSCKGHSTQNVHSQKMSDSRNVQNSSVQRSSLPTIKKFTCSRFLNSFFSMLSPTKLDSDEKLHEIKIEREPKVVKFYKQLLVEVGCLKT